LLVSQEGINIHAYEALAMTRASRVKLNIFRPCLFGLHSNHGEPTLAARPNRGLVLCQAGSSCHALTGQETLPFLAQRRGKKFPSSFIFKNFQVNLTALLLHPKHAPLPYLNFERSP
jgi:hypothetical protein